MPPHPRTVCWRSARPAPGRGTCSERCRQCSDQTCTSYRLSQRGRPRCSFPAEKISSTHGWNRGKAINNLQSDVIACFSLQKFNQSCDTLMDEQGKQGCYENSPQKSDNIGPLTPLHVETQCTGFYCFPPPPNKGRVKQKKR